jgi:murein hydrolase activator
MLFLVQGVKAQPPNRTDLEKQKKIYESEISELNQQLKSLKGESSKLFKQSSLIEEKIRLRNNIVGSIDDEINYIGLDINKAEQEIARLDRELDTLKKQYAKSVVFAYKNRSNYDFLNFIFSSGNFNDAFRRVTYLKTYRDYQTSRAESINRTKNFLKEKKEILKGNKDQKTLKYKEQELALKKLEEDKQEKEALASKFKAKENEISSQVDKKKKALNKISANIQAIVDRIRKEEKLRIAKEKKERADAKKAADAERKRLEAIARAEAKKNNTSIKPPPVKKEPAKEDPVEPAEAENIFEATSETKKISTSFSGNKGRLPFPVDGGYITAGFGEQNIPGTKIKFINPGVSIEGEIGAPVKAIFEGEVSAIAVEGAGTFTIYIRHGKYISTYSNVQNITVNKGDKVTLGQMIGKMATNDEGNGGIEFLISEVTNNTTKNVNPESWIRRK